MNLQIISKSDYPLPHYATKGSVGMDLYANISDIINLKPLERTLIPTGIFIGLEEGFEAQIRPRSGLALKQGLTVLNTPGTIDSDYIDEIGVILINLSNNEINIKPGDRIAQMVFNKIEKPHNIKVVKTLERTTRNGGFGSTGE